MISSNHTRLQSKNQSPYMSRRQSKIREKGLEGGINLQKLEKEVETTYLLNN